LKDKNEIIPGEDITSVEIEEALEKPGMFKILLNDILDTKTLRFRWLDDNRIKPGNLLEISFSYASSSKKSTLVFLGRIKSVTHHFDSSGEPTLSVTGFDLSHDLQESWRGDSVYTDKTYSKIIADVAYSNKLKRGKIDETKTVYENVSRWFEEDDYQFIKRLTENIGFEFFVRGESYYFRKPEDEIDADTIFTNGINIVKFTPEVSSSALVNEVQLNSWDRYRKERISQTAKLADIKKCVYIPQDLKGQGYEKKVLENINVPSSEEAKVRAVAELKRKNKRLFKGQLVSIGNPSLRPGMPVKIEKIGKLFSGVYYVEETKHSINQKEYSTTLEVRRCK
jgi:phage protein D